MRSLVNCRLLGSALRGFPSAKQQSNSYRTACHVWRRLACNARRLGSKCSRRLPISRLLRSLPTPSGPRQRTNGCGNQARHDQPRSGNYPGRTQESEALALVCRRGQTPSRSTEGRSSTQPRGKTSTAEGVGVPSRRQNAAYAAVLALNTTMRGCEIKDLRWRYVNFLEKTLMICKSKTNAGERVIPLNHDRMEYGTSALRSCEEGRRDSTRPLCIPHVRDGPFQRRTATNELAHRMA